MASLCELDTTTILAQVRRVLAIERGALEELEQRVDVTIAHAIALLHDCPGRIIVTGMGKAGLIGRKFAATLASTGSPAFYLHPAEACHGDLGIVTSDDVLVCLSNSGETDEVNQLLPAVKRVGVQIIALTGQKQGTLARYSDVVLDVGIAREADPHGVAPTTSTTVMLALCDALAIAVMTQRGFTQEQFARVHPGGHLGRRLLLLVSDLMHSGPALPCVTPEVTVRDAICEMTQKGLGATLIVDAAGELAGIFTDGDVRRLLQGHTHPLQLRIAEVMIRTPKQITAAALAVEALQLMQQHSIAVLPVIRDGRPCGILHLQDLLRARLA